MRRLIETDAMLYYVYETCNKLTNFKAVLQLIFSMQKHRIKSTLHQAGHFLASSFQPNILTTLRTFTAKTFFSDLTAGTIVGIVAFPLAIAFGIASGVSPERGLITAIIAGSSYCFWGVAASRSGGQPV